MLFLGLAKEKVSKCAPVSVLKKAEEAKHKRQAKRAAKYFGDNVYCTCCGKSFSGFQDFKFRKKYQNPDMFQNTSKGVICPHCGSYPRHRIICDYLEKNGFLSENSATLLFAPLYGMRIWFEKRGIPYISADIFDRKADVKVDIQNIQINGQGEDLFAFVSCDHILEHVPDYKKALKELFRVIKPGGCVEISVPLDTTRDKTFEDNSITNPVARAKAYGQYDHLRIFGMDFYDALKEVGFDVTVYDGDDCDAKIVPVTGPGMYDYNKIFLCKK